MSKRSQKNSPIQVSLTGGIGAGKSTVAKIFGVLGVPVFDADSSGRKLLDEDPILREEIIKIFGGNSYKGAQPNRAFLAEKIFDNVDLRRELNALVHPRVAASYLAWSRSFSDLPYLIREAAIALESGSASDVDFVVLVVAPVETRIERVSRRNGISREAVLQRMDAQWSDERKMRSASFVVHNGGESPIIPQILHIHHMLLKAGDGETLTFEKNIT